MAMTIKMCLKLSLVFVVCLSLPLSYSIRLDRDTSNSEYVHWPGGLESIEKVIELNGFSTPQQCSRKCTYDDRKDCYYRFHVERYSVMGSACKGGTSNNTFDSQCVLCDGYERSAYTMNRQIPAPTIEVCKGDTVHIDVVNLTPGSSITIHWHGILQFNASHYDGVPYVSQCPIPPGNTFRYKWKAANAGTHFYHSHMGLQKMDGLAGPIIIREPKSGEPRNLYDKDLSQHVLFLLDWTHHYLDRNFPGNRFTNVGQRPFTLLINGKGKFRNAGNDEYSNVEVFNVKPGRRYRFRYINAAASVCPMQLFIEQHKIDVIATDGHFIEPVTVDSIICASAERFDFVISTNKANGSYWVYAKSRETCEAVQADQIAILRYEGSPVKPQTTEPTYTNSLPSTKVLNPMDSYCNYTRDDAICISQLNSTKTVPKILLDSVTTQIYMSFRVDFSDLDTFKPHTYPKHFVTTAGRLGAGTINNIIYEAPPSPLTSQYNDVDPRHFCKKGNLPNNCSSMCKCTHLVRIPLKSVVELILVDGANVPGIHHPFHYHGYAPRIMNSMTTYPVPINVQTVMNMDKQGKINRRRDERPPLKDTIMIPSHGFVVLRFLADNPGFWFLHCHFLIHLITGMEAVIQVGSIEDMQQTPYNFPKCGHYKTDV